MVRAWGIRLAAGCGEQVAVAVAESLLAMGREGTVAVEGGGQSRHGEMWRGGGGLGKRGEKKARWRLP